MSDGLFPSTYFAEGFFSYGFFGEYGEPTPPTPSPVITEAASSGRGGLTRLHKEKAVKSVYDETRDEAELFILILAFLKAINQHP